MDIKERILNVLRDELEPFGYRYIKSESEFKRKVDKDTIVYLYCCASRYRHRGFTTVTFYARGDYRDLRKELQNQCIIDNIQYWYFGFCSRLPWIMPKDDSSSLGDFDFRDDDTEEIINQKLDEMAWCVRIHLIPFLERLSHRGSALEEAIALDRRFLVTNEFLIPIMYCVWKHDKKTALDYLENRGRRLLSLVDPGQWILLERMKNGEHIMQDDKPINAIVYEDYVKGSVKIKEWIRSQDYGG